MNIKLIELFSGIGGFAKGLQEAGFNITKHQFSEIDKHAIANYKYNFKNAKYIGSVNDVRGKRNQADIITFGSPCQDFSLAGKRKGMEGQRSSLILQAIRLIAEVKPSVFIWENVKGTFSSNNGADFWAIINAFTNIGGYRLEWQLLNTSWFLPQNRERIYLIGHLAKRSNPRVFPITKNDRFCYKPKENKKKVYPNNKTTAITQLSRQFTSWSGDYIQVEIAKLSRTDEAKKIRSQNLKNGKDYNPFQGKKLDFVKSNVMNTINCALQKDNLIKVPSNTEKNYIQWDASGKGHKSQQDRAFFEDKNMGTIPSTRTENKVNVLLNNQKIRRLTEIECERLQGFPDNWTKYGNYDGEVKEISKTNRYKMCGNAVTVAVVKAIGTKLKPLLNQEPKTKNQKS